MYLPDDISLAWRACDQSVALVLHVRPRRVFFSRCLLNLFLVFFYFKPFVVLFSNTCFLFPCRWTAAEHLILHSVGIKTCQILVVALLTTAEYQMTFRWWIGCQLVKLTTDWTCYCAVSIRQQPIGLCHFFVSCHFTVLLGKREMVEEWITVIQNNKKTSSLLFPSAEVTDSNNVFTW